MPWGHNSPNVMGKTIWWIITHREFISLFKCLYFKKKIVSFRGPHKQESALFNLCNLAGFVLLTNFWILWQIGFKFVKLKQANQLLFLLEGKYVRID